MPLSPSCLFPLSSIVVLKDFIWAGTQCNICRPQPLIHLSVHLTFRWDTSGVRQTSETSVFYFRNSLHERGRNITDHHSVSLFKDICFLSLDSTTGAYGGNVLSRLKEQFNPRQWLSRCPIISKKLHWALNHQTINRNKEEKSCWSYRFLRLTASFVDYKYFNCMPGSVKRNWISYLMPVLEFYFKVYFKQAPCTSIMWDDSVNERVNVLVPQKHLNPKTTATKCNIFTTFLLLNGAFCACFCSGF